jgi:phage-related holin
VKKCQVRHVFRFSYLECVNYIHAFVMMVAEMTDTILNRKGSATRAFIILFSSLSQYLSI